MRSVRKYRPRVRIADVIFAWSTVVGCISAGCEDKITQLVVVVDTDLNVPNDIDLFEIDVEDFGNTPLAGADLSQQAPPRFLGLVHDRGPLGPITIIATAKREDQEVLVQRLARLFFVKDQTKALNLDLLESCVGVECPAEQTCGEFGCRSIDIAASELSDWNPSSVTTGPVFQWSGNGTAANSDIIVSDPIPAATGGLFIVAFAGDSADNAVISVTGLGLEWTRIDQHCSAKADDPIDVWWAQGTAGGSQEAPQRVTATLRNTTTRHDMIIASYSDVNSSRSIGSITKINENGVDNSCSDLGNAPNTFIVDPEGDGSSRLQIIAVSRQVISNTDDPYGYYLRGHSARVSLVEIWDYESSSVEILLDSFTNSWAAVSFVIR